MGKFVIKNGRIVDGTGSESYFADIKVVDGRIVEIGTVIDLEGTIIDAIGLVVSPGFIDIHTHTDATIYKYPSSASKLLQGVTSEVTGSCGVGNFPVAQDSKLKTEFIKFLGLHDFSIPQEGIVWTDFSGFSEHLSHYPLGTNILPLVAHGPLRIAVVGYDNRQATESELAELCELLDKQLCAGAWGMSSGLIYPPGSFANTQEFVYLCKVLARHDALYTTHIRNESNSMMEALEEAINIAKQSDCKIQISHLKAIGMPNWGKGKQALQRINDAKADGVSITVDQYPYEASATGLSVLLPDWVHEGGVESLIDRLGDPAQLDKILPALNCELAIRGGAERVVLTSFANGRKEFIGKTLAEVAAILDLPVDMAIVGLLREQKGSIAAVYFSISSEDIETIIQSNLATVGSDGRGVEITAAQYASIHPRSYGTFARVLGKYVREKQLLSIEQAIYKMSALPASVLGLEGRGTLSVGQVADITIFDLETIADKSTFTEPHCYAQGIKYVLVNGGLAVSNGQLTGNNYGKVLKKK